MALPATRSFAPRALARPALAHIPLPSSSSRCPLLSPPTRGISTVPSAEENPRSALAVPLKDIKFLSFPPVTPHPPTNHIHVATLHLQSHHPYNLDLLSQFAVHSAHSLQIPTSLPAFLPKRKELHTVLKSPFVKKKAQENFERWTHKRAIKVFDAEKEAVDLWLRYLRQNGLPGVGMKAYIHEYVDYGFGEQLEEVNEVEMEVQDKRIAEAADELVKGLTASEEVKGVDQGSEGVKTIVDAAKEEKPAEKLKGEAKESS
ncbi:hypothetical protein B9479_001370 [Cryptococcus floricola]|uniref:Small ribosomal subunit protein uS10m n=1 Tax=Cryptococcus floricola TaxID=2591691 RepID=A0A5D3B634_9TREE|nr:hypothetical protein B9479_001370 [Cryptococcus floricola]